MEGNTRQGEQCDERDTWDRAWLVSGWPQLHHFRPSAYHHALSYSCSVTSTYVCWRCYSLPPAWSCCASTLLYASSLLSAVLYLRIMFYILFFASTPRFSSVPPFLAVIFLSLSSVQLRNATSPSLILRYLLLQFLC